MNYYVYAYLRADFYTPYYIGKGSRRRCYDQGTRPFNIPKDKNRIVKLKTNLTEEEAFEFEKLMILFWGRKDNGTGILHNKTDGGEGPSGFIVNEEHMKKLHQGNIGRKRSEEGKANISRLAKERWKNPEFRARAQKNMKGINKKKDVIHSKEYREKMSRKMKEVWAKKKELNSK